MANGELIETKICPSGIIIENRPEKEWIELWIIKSSFYIYHNEFGPALVSAMSGIHYEEWYQNGKRHRLDGPAVSHRYKSNPKIILKSNYYIDGVFFHKEEYWNHPEVIRYKYLNEHPELEGFV